MPRNKKNTNIPSLTKPKVMKIKLECHDCSFKGTELIFINCVECRKHFCDSCVNVSHVFYEDVDEFRCHFCAPPVGKINVKQALNSHRWNAYDNTDITQSKIQVGTPQFIKNLKDKVFDRPTDNQMKILYMDGIDLTEQFFEENGFNAPIIIKDRNSINMKLQLPFPHDLVANEYGNERIDVIKTATGQMYRMLYSQFWECFTTDPTFERSPLNCLSLEISNSNLRNYVDPPEIVNKLDLENTAWLSEREKAEQNKVTRYLIMSQKGCFTDFHIDFGASSVWYTMLEGQKTFYLIEPTEENLKIYKDREKRDSLSRAETFLADKVPGCTPVTLYAGDTLLLPSGVIHAVFTEEKSVVLGGNFVHKYSIPMNIKIHTMEKSLKVGMKLRYPKFGKFIWCVINNFLQCLKNFNDKGILCPNSYWSTIEFLADYVKLPKKIAKNDWPEGIDVDALQREISRECQDFFRIKNPQQYLTQKRTVPEEVPAKKYFVSASDGLKFKIKNLQDASSTNMEKVSSFSQNDANDEENKLEIVTEKPKAKTSRKRKSRTTEERPERAINSVHQDSTFYYLELDLSDDDQLNSNNAVDVDSTWNPKNRIGSVAPKTDRPVRERVKNPAVEKVLEAAKAKRIMVVAKRHYTKRKQKTPKSTALPAEQVVPEEQPAASTSTTATIPVAIASTSAASSSFTTTPNAVVVAAAAAAPPPPPKVKKTPKTPAKTETVRKPKKGMATPKQRLGKLIGLHKNKR